jgi:PITH domain
LAVVIARDVHACHLIAELQLSMAHAESQVRCLNEATENSSQGVFRAWDKRLEAPENPMESNEDDPELLLHVPFEGAAKVKALCIIGKYSVRGVHCQTEDVGTICNASYAA